MIPNDTKLWGQEHLFLVQPTTVDASGQQSPISYSKQVVNVRHGRPDTWAFLFGVQFLSRAGDQDDPPAIAFDVELGIGMQTIQLLDFVTFQVNPSPGPRLYCQQVFKGTVQTPGGPGYEIVDRLVADRIQVVAHNAQSGNVIQSTLTLLVFAAFSPIHHPPHGPYQR